MRPWRDFAHLTTGGYMTTEVTKRAYVAPTLERLPIGATANESAQNGDIQPFVANTATLPTGS
jgi:hypothetical protein